MSGLSRSQPQICRSNLTTVFSNNTVAVRGLNILKSLFMLAYWYILYLERLSAPSFSITLTAEFGACSTTCVEFWTRSGMSSSMNSRAGVLSTFHVEMCMKCDCDFCLSCTVNNTILSSEKKEQKYDKVVTRLYEHSHTVTTLHLVTTLYFETVATVTRLSNAS